MFDFVKNISPTEIIILVLILVILFGGKSIAMRLARSGGGTVKEAKKIKKEFTEAIKDDDAPEKNK